MRFIQANPIEEAVYLINSYRGSVTVNWWLIAPLLGLIILRISVVLSLLAYAVW